MHDCLSLLFDDDFESHLSGFLVRQKLNKYIFGHLLLIPITRVAALFCILATFSRVISETPPEASLQAFLWGENMLKIQFSYISCTSRFLLNPFNSSLSVDIIQGHYLINCRCSIFLSIIFLFYVIMVIIFSLIIIP